MFRRALFSTYRLSTMAAGAGAAGVVVASDADLKKKPYWFRDAVHGLEEQLRTLSTYKPIESREVLDKAHDVLQRVVDQKHVEIFWRLARVLVEKAELVHDPNDKQHLLHEALEHLEKALAIEPSKGSAGAHKWYALALEKLAEVDKDLKKTAGKVAEQVKSHLERATKIDPHDPYAWMFLGVCYFKSNNYSQAIQALKKAEEISPNFSAANLYYLGECLRQDGQKQEAIETLKRALELPKHTSLDGKGKVQAKGVLMKSFKLSEKELTVKDKFMPTTTN